MPKAVLLPFGVLMIVSVLASNRPSADQSWIAISNGYANQLFAVSMKHHPDRGTREGLSQYDPLISQPTRADEDLERQETAEVLAKLKAAAAQQQQKEVAEDLQIMIRAVELQFREEDFDRAPTMFRLSTQAATSSPDCRFCSMNRPRLTVGPRP